jgi:hypothetical protein
MKAKRQWRFGVVVVGCLILAGCEGAGNKPTELTEQMQREITTVPPAVGGPSEEFSVAKKPADIVPAVETAFQNSGVRVVRTSSTDQGQRVFGKSLADRSVLVQILPVYPGLTAVKVTVEGADNLARDLLKRLSADIMQKAR